MKCRHPRRRSISWAAPSASQALNWRSSLRRELRMMPSAAGPAVTTRSRSRPGGRVHQPGQVAVTGQVAQLARVIEQGAPRARTMAAVDDTRRRIERDLHDGLQQRLVTLGLQVRAAEVSVPPADAELEWELARVA